MLPTEERWRVEAPTKLIAYLLANWEKATMSKDNEDTWRSRNAISHWKRGMKTILVREKQDLKKKLLIKKKETIMSITSLHQKWLYEASMSLFWNPQFFEAPFITHISLTIKSSKQFSILHMGHFKRRKKNPNKIIKI